MNALAAFALQPVVLIEMKKRDADLSKHYRQSLDWLAPDRDAVRGDVNSRV